MSASSSAICQKIKYDILSLSWYEISFLHSNGLE
jgi:hypothetical protein